MPRAKKENVPTAMPCSRCHEDTTNVEARPLERNGKTGEIALNQKRKYYALCEVCKEIGGGFVPSPPSDCDYAQTSPIGSHRCVEVLACAYKCGRADCRYGQRFSRINGAPIRTGRVTFKRGNTKEVKR